MGKKIADFLLGLNRGIGLGVFGASRFGETGEGLAVAEEAACGGGHGLERGGVGVLGEVLGEKPENGKIVGFGRCIW